MIETEQDVAADTQRPLPDGWRRMRLGDVCRSDRYVIQPGSLEAEARPYLSLEHVESNTGRILRDLAEAPQDEGRSTTFAFDARHVLYGKLRPYLNKVALPYFTGRCTTEMIPLRPTDVIDREFLAWLLRRPETVNAAMRETSGSRMPRATMEDLMTLLIPLPPLSEQRRIAAILRERMAAVERARAAAEAQMEAARALPAAYLRAVFESDEAREWPRESLANVGHLMPAKSIATVGDTPVLAVTTACLTESGFDPAGVKVARMWKRDVAESTLTAGEILIARSNTSDLVGRTAMYEGLPQRVVASDLTIRILPHSLASSGFLAAYLSWLYLIGYWKERAGGASDSMKKITRTQILALEVPLPTTHVQQRIAATLDEQMAGAQQLHYILQDQHDAIEALPAALLRQAFSGEL